MRNDGYITADYFCASVRPRSRWEGDKFIHEPVTDPAVELPRQDLFPHYTDARFKTEQTIFGKQEEGLCYDYSDRLHQWYGREKMNQAEAVAMQAGHAKYSANWFSEWVSAAHGYPVQVRHIVSGVGGNGYSYFVLGHRKVANDAA